jgi:hypothetical protein
MQQMNHMCTNYGYAKCKNTKYYIDLPEVF